MLNASRQVYFSQKVEKKSDSYIDDLQVRSIELYDHRSLYKLYDIVLQFTFAAFF